MRLLEIAIFVLLLTSLTSCVSENIPYFIYCPPEDLPQIRASMYSTHAIVEGLVWKENGYVIWIDKDQHKHTVYGDCIVTPLSQDFDNVVIHTHVVEVLGRE